MIVVCYEADGMKYVIREDIDMSDFWAIFRTRKRLCEEDDPDQTYVYRTGGNSFEEVDERLASGCTQYVARPDNWLINNGEPL